MLVQPQVIGKRLAAEEFDVGSPARWDWMREPSPATYRVTDGVLSWDVQAADLYTDHNSTSVLTTEAPKGDYVVETRVKLNLLPEGCCFTHVQAGLVLDGDDDNFIKLTEVSIWETRQTELAKELFPVPTGWSLYGNTVVGPPADPWTSLRIVVERLDGRERREAGGDTERYTAYTSQDGVTWVRGGAWTHHLGGARIGLVSMGGAGFTAQFDHVRVSRVR